MHDVVDLVLCSAGLLLFSAVVLVDIFFFAVLTSSWAKLWEGRGLDQLPAPFPCELVIKCVLCMCMCTFCAIFCNMCLPCCLWVNEFPLYYSI